MTFTITNHALDRLHRLDELHFLPSAEEFKELLLNADLGGTLLNGRKFKVVTFDGYTFGLGYTVDGGELLLTTILSPQMVFDNNERGIVEKETKLKEELS